MMWQNQDCTIELLPHLPQSRLGKAAVILVLFALPHLCCQMGFVETFWKPMWSIRFFELLFCFHPRQRCLALWAETMQAACALLLWVGSHNYTFLSARFPGSWDGGLEICDLTWTAKMEWRCCRLCWASGQQLQLCHPDRGKGSELLPSVLLVELTQAWAGLYTRCELTFVFLARPE